MRPAALTSIVFLLLVTVPTAQSPERRVALDDAVAAAAAMPRLHSMLVSWRGELVMEHYAKGVRAGRLANIKSAAKSVVSALTGVALARGLLKGLDQTIGSFFPDLRGTENQRKRQITIEDLLTMRSGLESTSGPNYGPWVTSRNWVRYVLTRPMVSEPGTSMEYSTGTSHLLSAILTKVTRKSTWQFANEVLGRPLGFTFARWPRDPQGIYFGGNEMLMTPRQMVAFGELYLNRGTVNGRQIVPARWVDESCVPRTRSRWNPDRQYGYGWWIREIGGRTACFAWGFGGQYIFVIRDLDLVVVTTSETTVSEERRGHRRGIFDIIERLIIPPVAAAAAMTQGEGSGRAGSSAFVRQP